MLCSHTKCVNCTSPMCDCARYTPYDACNVHLCTAILSKADVMFIYAQHSIAIRIHAQHHKLSAYSITTRACAQVLNPSSHTCCATLTK
jgi:hypothetical protein